MHVDALSIHWGVHADTNNTLNLYGYPIALLKQFIYIKTKDVIDINGFISGLFSDISINCFISLDGHAFWGFQ
jgi:hypothetical protein